MEESERKFERRNQEIFSLFLNLERKKEEEKSGSVRVLKFGFVRVEVLFPASSLQFTTRRSIYRGNNLFVLFYFHI